MDHELIDILNWKFGGPQNVVWSLEDDKQSAKMEIMFEDEQNPMFKDEHKMKTEHPMCWWIMI